MGLTGMYTAQADNLDTYRNLLIKKHTPLNMKI